MKTDSRDNALSSTDELPPLDLNLGNQTVGSSQGESPGNSLTFSPGSVENFWDLRINSFFADQPAEFHALAEPPEIIQEEPTSVYQNMPSTSNEMILQQQFHIPNSSSSVALYPTDTRPEDWPTRSGAETNADKSRLQPSRFYMYTEILSPLRRGLNDASSVLVEYYFKDVAGLISCYDSQMNPFRSTVSRVWTSSRIMSCTLQSVAASCLIDEFPHVARVGTQMRREALALIEKETALDEKSLLALLMLGETASWHDPHDLGLPYFNRLKNALQAMCKNGLRNDKNVLFFKEALVYWEMLLSFVADDSLMVISTPEESQPESDAIIFQQRPHPWTGIARGTQIALYEIGRLVRKERRRVRVTSQADIDQAQEAISKARELEARLLSQIYPSEYDIISPGDSETPVSHLLAIADVYRFTGLIQLYRVFPDLLERRFNANEPFIPPTTYKTSLNTRYISSQDLFQGLRASNEERLSETARNEWLTHLAITTLDLIQSLPIGSRTRSLTPFLLVALSSELRVPILALIEENTASRSLAAESSRLRKFIIDRLTFFLRVLAPKPIYVCLDLVHQIWARMDAGEDDIFWMDVMIENGWETTMG